MNEKKDKKSKKPECVSKNWKPSQGIKLLAMVLAWIFCGRDRCDNSCTGHGDGRRFAGFTERH